MEALRIERDFFARPRDEQKLLLTFSYCDWCDIEGFTKLNPREYEINGEIFISGYCPVCSGECITEIMQPNGRYH